MKKKILMLAAVVFSNHLHAQSVAAASLKDSTKNLDEVVITATKFPKKQSETGKLVTIIGPDILQKSMGRSLADLLNQQAAIIVPGAQNVLGSNVDVYLRGSIKVLILLDGVPAYDASSIGNVFDLNQIPVAGIERVEILKGGQSTLYGSDAVAGVINIISKKTAAKKMEAYAGASAGSYGTFRGTAGLAGKVRNTSYTLYYNTAYSNGVSAAYDSTGNKNFDKDGCKQHAVNASVTTMLCKNLQAGLHSQYSKYRTDADGAAFTDDKDYTLANSNLVNGITAQYKTKKGAVYFNASLAGITRHYVNDSLDVSGFADFVKEKYTGNSFFAEIYTAQNIQQHIEVVTGIDYRFQNSNQDYLSLKDFIPYKTSIGSDSVNNKMYSVYASLLIKKLGGFNAEMGGRYNRHSQYGNSFTYTFNPSYTINNWKIFTNISSAFKAPSLYQLFGPGVANSKLEAEKSVTYETGIAYATQNFTARAVYFYRTIKNGIGYNLASFSYFNNNKQQDKGVELEAGFKKDNFSFNASYCYLTGNVNTKKYRYNAATYSFEITGDTSFNNLFRRPKHTLNATLGYQFTKQFFASSSVRMVGRRYEGQFEALPVELEPYSTIDLYAGYKINNHITLFADLRNISNKKFFDVWGYNSRRFNAMAGINCTF